MRAEAEGHVQFLNALVVKGDCVCHSTLSVGGHRPLLNLGPFGQCLRQVQ